MARQTGTKPDFIASWWDTGRRMQMVVTSLVHYGPRWNPAALREAAESNQAWKLTYPGERRKAAFQAYFLACFSLTMEQEGSIYNILSHCLLLIIIIIINLLEPLQCIGRCTIDLLKWSHLIFITTQWGDYCHYPHKKINKNYIRPNTHFPKMIHQKSPFIFNCIESLPILWGTVSVLNLEHQNSMRKTYLPEMIITAASLGCLWK